MDIWGKSIQAEGPAHGASCVRRWECQAYAERARSQQGEEGWEELGHGVSWARPCGACSTVRTSEEQHTGNKDQKAEEALHRCCGNSEDRKPWGSFHKDMGSQAGTGRSFAGFPWPRTPSKGTYIMPDCSDTHKGFSSEAARSREQGFNYSCSG